MDFIRGQPIRDTLSRCDARILAALAQRHKLSGPISAEILRQGTADGDIAKWAAIADMACVRDAMNYARLLRASTKLLRDAGIESIALKGATLSFGKSRDIGDIDLLIRKEDLPRAIQTLESAGFAYAADEMNERIGKSEYRNWKKLLSWLNQFQLRDTESGALVELHVEFFESDRVYVEDLTSVERDMDSVWESSAWDATLGCRTLSKEDRTLLLAMHAGIKRTPYLRSFILRHILDFDRLIAAGIDWDAVILKAEKRRILHHLCFLVSIYESISGNRVPEEARFRIRAGLTRLQSKLVEINLSCMRSLGRESYFHALEYRFLHPFAVPSKTTEKLRSILILPLLFPSYLRLKGIYGCSRDAKLGFLLYPLEPIRWCLLFLNKYISRKTLEA